MKYFLLMIALIAAGCTPDRPPSKSVSPPSAPALEAKVAPASSPTLDPLPAAPTMIQVDVFLVSVPFGSVSRSDAFWKRVDELAVDVGTHDILLNNGLRVGFIQKEQQPAVKALLDANPNQTLQSNTVGAEGRNVELPMSREIELQDVFYFDAKGRMAGTTFENCTNLVQMSFVPTPRKPDSVRVSLCPAVRRNKKRLIEKETETIFDLNLRADVNGDQVLVVAPSPDAKRSVSIGNLFFTNPQPAGKDEYVLLIRVQPLVVTPVVKNGR